MTPMSASGRILSLRVQCVGVTSFIGYSALLNDDDSLHPQHYLVVFVVLLLRPSTQRHLVWNIDEVLSQSRGDGYIASAVRPTPVVPSILVGHGCASWSCETEARQFMGHGYFLKSTITIATQLQLSTFLVLSKSLE